MDTILMLWRCLVLLMTVTTPLAQSQTKSPILCATGTFAEGSLGFVECLFNRNINTTDSRYNFNVVHYRANQRKTGNNVVLCNWRQEELECNTGESDGYSFDMKVSDRLTVVIDAVSEVHAGMYACQVLPDDDIPVDTCTLLVKALTTTTSQPCTATLPQPEAERNSAVAVLVVVPIVCSVVLIVTMIVIVLVYCFKRRGLPSSKIGGVSCCRNANSAEAGEVNKVKARLDRESEIAVDITSQADIPLLEVPQTPANPLTTRNQPQHTQNLLTQTRRELTELKKRNEELDVANKALVAANSELESQMKAARGENEKAVKGLTNLRAAAESKLKQLQATAAGAHAAIVTTATTRGASGKGGASADETLTRENEQLNAKIKQLEMESRKGGDAEVAKLRTKLATLDTDNKKLAEENKVLTENYKSELLLRKKYYNMMEDMKGKIRVYCRVRPMLPGESARGNISVVKSPDEYSITVQTAKSGLKEFRFDQVFMPGSTQEEVFEDTNSLIQSAVDGYNVCIFAYGQTGSGKTFTMIGDQADKFPGIAPRAFRRIFQLADENKGKIKMTVKAYMLELYNEKLIDLFTRPDLKDKVEIKTDKKGMAFIQGAVVKPASNAEELCALLEGGFKYRHTAPTKMNAESSRSHLIVGVMIESTVMNWATDNVVRGKLSLVDLAGSERFDKTPGASAETQKEAISINKSLSALSNVILALSSKQKHIPYKDSKLTELMQDSLGGNAKTLMFVNISPADYDADETVASLEYASRVKGTTTMMSARMQPTKSLPDSKPSKPR